MTSASHERRARRLHFRQLSSTLGGKRRLEAASAVFDAGPLHAVVGKSGAGKSVLVKSALGLLPLDEGEVCLERADGSEVCARADDERSFAWLRQDVVLVQQDAALLDDMSAEANVAFVVERRRRDLTAKQRHKRVKRWLSQLELTDVASAVPSELSPGLRRRVALARALCIDPLALIVDEPTTGLDPHAARNVDAALQQVADTGVMLLMVTHDVRSLLSLQPHMTWVHERQVQFQGEMAHLPVALRNILDLDENNALQNGSLPPHTTTQV